MPMPDWTEWSGLKPDQRQYSLYKVLSDIYDKIDNISTGCNEQKGKCAEEFGSKDEVAYNKRLIFILLVCIVVGSFAYVVKGLFI